MTKLQPWHLFSRFRERESLQPDLSRAVRGTIAFMVPVALSLAGWLPVEVSLAALAGQNIAMVDVRGAYRMRLALLVAMTAVFVGAAALGSVASPWLWSALLATALIAACGGLWRHLSSDYGMSLAISSTLVFLIALNSTDGWNSIGSHCLATLVGGTWGLILQVINWPFKPQHPLRRTVADSWLAVADLFEALAPVEASGAAARQARVHEREVALRNVLDQSYAAIEAAHAGPFRERLNTLNLTAARLSTRVVALNTALEGVMAGPAFASLAPALQPLLTALTNTSRTVALAVVSRQPAHLAAADVRVRRLTNLLRVLQSRLGALSLDPLATAQLREILRQIETYLPTVQEALRATIDRAAERAAFSLELFDLHTLTLRPLASALNLSWQVDPALVRFVMRIGVLMMFGVAVFKSFPGSLAHGYWLPFTMVVVLQPDYGSTRKRAAQRMLGTFTGSIVASGVMYLALPFWAVMTTLAVTVFAFGYMVKRNYGIAVFFVTLFIVLLTEAGGQVTVAFTIERLTVTLAGGLLALLAALFFWPVWERDRFPPILAKAFRANSQYLKILVARLTGGGIHDAESIAAKRAAETANAAVFSSLQRITGDPKNQQAGIEYAATLANGNQRFTRALSVLTLHLTPGAAPLAQAELKQFAGLAGEALDALARVTESGVETPRALEPLLQSLEKLSLPVPPPEAERAGPEAQRNYWAFAQLTRAGTELSAMLLAAMDAAPALGGKS